MPEKKDQETSAMLSIPTGELAIRQFEAMKGTRNPHESLWSEISENMFPMKAMFRGKYAGKRLGHKMYDLTAQTCVMILAAHIASAISPAQQVFFDYAPMDPRLANNWSVKKYTEDKVATMWDVLSSSNFQPQSLQMYLDEVLFGNGCVYVEPHPEMYVGFSSRDLSEIYFDTDNFGTIDTVARAFSMTVRQMVQEFGRENVPMEVWDKAMHPDFAREKRDIMHLTRPNAYFEPGMFGPAGMRFESIYVDVTSRTVLAQSGYHEFPYMIPRWFVCSGETYGRGPAESVLPDVRNLHVMSRHYVRATQKATDPALLLPQKAFLGTKLDLGPGRLNFYRATGMAGGPKELVGQFPGGERAFPVASQDLQRLREDVKRGLFVDKIQLTEKDRMTRAEVIQRVDDGYRVIGPILGRNNNEFIAPMLKRVDGILTRAGLMPEEPEILKRSGGLKLVYKSPLSKALKMADAQGFVSAMDVLMPLFQADPAMMEQLKRGEIPRFIFDAFGAPAKLVETPEESGKREKAVREKQEQQEQAAMGMEAVQGMAGATADIAKATKDLGGIERLGGLM